MNVWMVRESREKFDHSQVEAHGTLMKPIFSNRVSPHDTRLQVEVIRRDVMPFATKEDAIITVGPQLMVSVLTALWVKEFGCVRFLAWNAYKQQYVMKELSIVV